MTSLKIINNSNKNGQIITYLIDPSLNSTTTTTTTNSTSNNELTVSSNNNINKISPKLTNKSKSMTRSSSLKRILKSPFTKRRNTTSTSSNPSTNTNNNNSNSKNKNNSTSSNNGSTGRRRHSSVDQIEKTNKNNNTNNSSDGKKRNNSQNSLKHQHQQQHRHTSSSLSSSTKQVDVISGYTTQSSATSPITLNKQYKSNNSTISNNTDNNNNNNKKSGLMNKLSSKLSNNNKKQNKKDDNSYYSDVHISIKQESTLIISQQEETRNNLNLEVAKKVFKYFDSNSKGYVTVEDVESVIKKLDHLKNEIEFPNEKQINDSFNIYCKSEKGKLNFIEFTEILNYGLDLNNENDEMIYLFRQFDLNNDGIIERHELKSVMQFLFPNDEINDCDIDRMLDEADLDNNGSIDYYEFGSLFRLFKSHINTELDKTRELVDKSFKNCGVVYQISNRKMQTIDLKEAFEMFDKNGDNKISPSELEQVMKYLGLNPNTDHVRNMIKVVDTNGNGYVDYDEFISMMTQTKIKPRSDDDELKEIFKVFDIDGNGYISAEEIKRKMADLGIDLSDHEVAEMIKAADIDHDGQINLHEFTKLLESAKIMSK